MIEAIVLIVGWLAEDEEVADEEVAMIVFIVGWLADEEVVDDDDEEVVDDDDDDEGAISLLLDGGTRVDEGAEEALLFMTMNRGDDEYG